MGQTRSKCTVSGKYKSKFSGKNLKGSDNLGDLDIDGTAIFRRCQGKGTFFQRLQQSITKTLQPGFVLPVI
jgi:hypothetical protein